jgi:recombination protein RecT
MPKQQKKQHTTTITTFVRDNKDNLAKYAVRDYSQSEFLNSITIAVQENEKLQECLKSDEGQNSMYHALRLGAHTGLSLNPQSGFAALVPYKGRVSYQIMKNGLIKLAMDSGKVKFLTAEKVRENDEFTIGKSFDGDTFHHVPAKTDRGNVVGYYAGIKMTDGSSHLSYMTVSEVQDHGQKYSFFYNNESGPWQTSFDGMAKKTVIKELFRNLHISYDTSVAVGADDSAEQEILHVGSARVKGTSPDDARQALMEQDDGPEPEPEEEPEYNRSVHNQGNHDDII